MLRIDTDTVEKVFTAELWNAFKVYPHQLEFDHAAGTINVLKNEDAVLINPAPSGHEEVSPANGTDWTLEELYKLIDTDLIEVVPVNDDLILIVDEEGLCKESPIPNPEASGVVEYHNRHFKDKIVGKAILCPSSMLK